MKTLRPRETLGFDPTLITSNVHRVNYSVPKVFLINSTIYNAVNATTKAFVKNCYF